MQRGSVRASRPSPTRFELHTSRSEFKLCISSYLNLIFLADRFSCRLRRQACSWPLLLRCSAHQPPGRCISCRGPPEAAQWEQTDSSSVDLHRAAQSRSHSPSGRCSVHRNDSQCRPSENTLMWLYRPSSDQRLVESERLMEGGGSDSVITDKEDINKWTKCTTHPNIFDQ